VWALKEGRLDYLAAAWADELLDRVAAELPPIDAVVAVPLHWWRRLGRGYDQAELLAAAIGRRLESPRLGMRRRRATRAQTEQTAAERRRNLRGAFAVSHPVRGLDVLLVDDVVTTGSTLRAAAGALAVAGAASITALALARTPAPSERR
jgi:ComF family protein